MMEPTKINDQRLRLNSTNVCGIPADLRVHLVMVAALLIGASLIAGCTRPDSQDMSAEGSAQVAIAVTPEALAAELERGGHALEGRRRIGDLAGRQHQ